MTCQLKHWAGSIHRPLPPGGPQLRKGGRGKEKILTNAFHVFNVLQLQGRNRGRGEKRKNPEGVFLHTHRKAE
ncbi:hypothetical protein N322_06574, partial [Cariama cristata]